MLSPEQIASLASNAKKAPCNWLKNGKSDLKSLPIFSTDFLQAYSVHIEINAAGAMLVLTARNAFISVKVNAGSRLVSSIPSTSAFLLMGWTEGMHTEIHT